MLLLKVTQVDGPLFPIGIFTVHAVMKCITDITGKNPADIDILTDCEVVVQMEPAKMAVSIPQELHNACVWDGSATEITCLVSTWKHVLDVAHE